MANTSGLFSINWADAGKGFITAAIAAALTSGYQALTTGKFTLDDLKVACIAGLTAGIAYLIKNFFTPATDTKPDTDHP